MKVSVIVPSYNQGEFIQRTLDSIMSQQGIELELLIFDGGSSDGTLDILKKLPPSVAWVSASDGGQTVAINSGIKVATGDILAYLNSDDIYYPNAIRRVIEEFNKNPDIEILYGNGNHIDLNDNIIEPYYNEEWDYNRLIDICFICQPAVFWKRSIVDKFGFFDESLNYAMDYDYWLRIGKKMPIHYLPGAALAGSRLHLDNKTLSRRLPVHEEILSVVMRHSPVPPYKWLKNLAHIRMLEDCKDNVLISELEKQVMFLESLFYYARLNSILFTQKEIDEIKHRLEMIGI